MRVVEAADHLLRGGLAVALFLLGWVLASRRFGRERQVGEAPDLAMD